MRVHIVSHQADSSHGPVTVGTTGRSAHRTVLPERNMFVRVREQLSLTCIQGWYRGRCRMCCSGGPDLCSVLTQTWRPSRRRKCRIMLGVEFCKCLLALLPAAQVAGQSSTVLAYLMLFTTMTAESASGLTMRSSGAAHSAAYLFMHCALVCSCICAAPLLQNTAVRSTKRQVLESPFT